MTQQKAPVALFVFNRPEHTRRTLASLAANTGAADTDLIVFSDAARGDAGQKAVAETRAVVCSAKGFKSVEVIERQENLRGVGNIVDGVSRVMKRYGRAIVVEDDIVTARGFLDYMNAALDTYRDEKQVWHISGWSYPISPEGLPDYFFWRVMNCWGWASWADRWQQYQRDPDRLYKGWDRQTRNLFNVDGAHDFFAQIEDNVTGRKRTWDIFWYATIFEADGLCLNPTIPYVRNIGLDGSGQNCGPAPEEMLDPSRPFDGNLPDRVEINEAAVARIRAHLALPMYRRLSGQIKRGLRRLMS